MNLLKLIKEAYYAGYRECKDGDANCFTGWREWRGTQIRIWLLAVKEEQTNYPSLKGIELSEPILTKMWNEGKSPIEALNDLITIV